MMIFIFMLSWFLIFECIFVVFLFELMGRRSVLFWLFLCVMFDWLIFVLVCMKLSWCFIISMFGLWCRIWFDLFSINWIRWGFLFVLLVRICVLLLGEIFVSVICWFFVLDMIFWVIIRMLLFFSWVCVVVVVLIIICVILFLDWIFGIFLSVMSLSLVVIRWLLN